MHGLDCALQLLQNHCDVRHNASQELTLLCSGFKGLSNAALTARHSQHVGGSHSLAPAGEEQAWGTVWQGLGNCLPACHTSHMHAYTSSSGLECMHTPAPSVIRPCTAAA